MTMTVHLFNPQNDLALADGSPNFTSPKAAVDLANAGACLPMWYGHPGDCFIGAVNAKWFKDISECFGLEVRPTMRVCDNAVPQPWGWSPQVLKFLREFGFDDILMPDDKAVHRLRELSSRVAGADVITRLMHRVPEMTDVDPANYAPVIAYEPETAVQTIERFGVAMMKLPWSNSGRGQQVTDRTTPDELMRRICGMIHRQGCVEIAPYYEKILDFAMLWDRGEFVGYSLFETDSHGGWTRNILLHDSHIEERILQALDRPVSLDRIKDALQDLLFRDMDAETERLSPLVGVDFLIGRRPGTANMIIPVEINRRRTMGHVAHCLRQNFMSEDVNGTFRIIPRTSMFNTAADCVIEGRRLVRGSLDLVPPGGNFRFLLTAGSE